MEENSKHTTAYEDMLIAICGLEESVNKIYFIGQFEVADEFAKKVSDLKKRFLAKAYSHKTQILNTDFDDILDESVQLKLEIQDYFDREGTDIENKMTREIYIRRTDEVVSATEQKTTKELWAGVKKIVEDWNIECREHPRFEVQQHEIDKTVAKAVLKILERQVKSGEEIDLNPVDEVTYRKYLVEVIKEKLIQQAREDENLKKRSELLETAKYLTEDRLNKPKIWKQLTGINDVKIKKAQSIGIIKSSPTEISKPKRSEFKKRFFGKTIYTLGDIDEETGEWINVREVYGKFPKKFSERNMGRVLKIEINGVRRVNFYDLHTREPVIDMPNYWNLQEVVLGNGIESLCGGTFLDYARLKKVKFGTGITKIPSECLKNSGIEKVIMSDNITEIESEAFYNCKKLKKIELYDGLKTIGALAFEGTGLQEITIPDSVNEIEEYAFADCGNLESIHIGKGLLNLSEGVFNQAKSLKSIKIPKNIDEIGDNAFYGCQSLENVKLEYGIKEIGMLSFSHTSLSHISIPDSIEEIYKSAFEECKFLKEIEFCDGIKLDMNAFFKLFDKYGDFDKSRIPKKKRKCDDIEFE